MNRTNKAFVTKKIECKSVIPRYLNNMTIKQNTIEKEKNNEEDYNTQKYSEDVDIIGIRTLQWFDEYILKYIDEIKGESVIDIGCGNGRHIRYLWEKFNTVYAIDPVCNIDEKHYRKNVWYGRKSLNAVLHMRFDVVLMFGSYNVLRRIYGTEIYGMIDKILKDNSIVFGYAGRTSHTAKEEFKNNGYWLCEINDALKTTIFGRGKIWE